MDAAEIIMAGEGVSYAQRRIGGTGEGEHALAHWECRYAGPGGASVTVPFSGNVTPHAVLVLQCLGADLADLGEADRPADALAGAWGIGRDDAAETAGWLGKLRDEAADVFGEDAVAALVAGAIRPERPAPGM